MESNCPYLLVVEAWEQDKLSEGGNKFYITYSWQLYEVMMLYEDVLVIGQDQIYKRIKGRRKDKACILHNINWELLPIHRLQWVVLSTNKKLKNQWAFTESLHSLKQKLSEHHITNATSLLVHKGFKLATLGTQIGASRELNALTGKSSAFLSREDLLRLSSQLGRDFHQEAKQRFADNGIVSSIEVYTMNIDYVARQWWYELWHYFMGYEFQRSKSAEEKKRDLVNKLWYNLIDDVKNFLATNHKITHSIWLLGLSQQVLYDGLSATVINKLLQKSYIYKSAELSLSKRVLLCQRLWRIVPKDLYYYFFDEKDAIEKLWTICGNQFAKFIETHLGYVTAWDSTHGRVLSEQIARYCIDHGIRFTKMDIVRRQKNYVLAMLLMWTSFNVGKNEKISTGRYKFTSAEQFVNKANARLDSIVQTTSRKSV